jgi:hypothetical protein
VKSRMRSCLPKGDWYHSTARIIVKKVMFALLNTLHSSLVVFTRLWSSLLQGMIRSVRLWNLDRVRQVELIALNVVDIFQIFWL